MGVRNRVAKKKPGVKIPTIKSAAQIALEATKHKPQNRIQPGTQLKLQPSMGSKKRLVSQIAGGTQSKAVDTKRTKMSLSGNVVSGVEKTDIASVKKAVNGDVKTTSPENTTVQTKVYTYHKER
ncbi:hypothetical protein SARC_03111 [Sphaeroforma arctica JP610]|uniref:Uncharacterized protein n=1 Tax=Sphaeroforma arctica JP610 TaxID=667725 RepID=A0A0L0G6P0_9EUKA|nr:hypothetical protein SARC_03111 [Sphaeroforma arctica JP610]KNC84677.1 hypothetical protein SARC_03111 [Sphaeroforma arctica JP610]|eukprot:XP_014158579.1 hypothetical protein SARC_03111 [Sphaeroforma arctica JP610]